MRIDQNLSRKQLPLQFNKMLSFIDTFNIKPGITIFLIIFLDTALLPLLYPRVHIIWIITMPLICFIHIWALRILFKNPYSVQFEAILFTGFLGTVASIIHLVTFLKMSYYNLNIGSSFFYVTSGTVYALIVVLLVIYYIKSYSNIRDNKRKAGTSVVKYSSLIVIAPTLGYVIAQIVINKSENLTNIMLLAVFAFFSIINAYLAVKFIYKYFFMKKNKHLIHLQEPTKKIKKEFQEKGIVIK
ncbi:hypothetical protein J5S49_09335 [Virgibacillus halodenitrificans]|uniref:hypothetical protein n=1 Tax=Virgibacillus halodenitrificans TaxID=1482 RepID=UPI001F406F50|nr:hypothetical protein [Virgibacillus halodenitrificans]MCG1028494.1 hypothetical protein [Virgibacillus halodenitrificans]